MMIDFEHYIGRSIGDEMLAQADLERKLSIIAALKPKFLQDGNQWCFCYGELPNDCIVGFGETPEQAMDEFVLNFHSQKALNMQVKNKESK